MSSVKSSIQQVYSALSTFFSAKASYLSGGGVPPSLTALSSLDPSDLQTEAALSVNDRADFSTGASTEAVATVFSAQREIAMASLSKAQLIAYAEAEAQEDSEFYDKSSVYESSVAAGVSTSGSSS